MTEKEWRAGELYCTVQSEGWVSQCSSSRLSINLGRAVTSHSEDTRQLTVLSWVGMIKTWQ